MTKSDKYIEVAIALPVYQAYTYRIPDHLYSMTSAGKRVLVPFGNRQVTGYILGPDTPGDIGEIKLITDVLDDTPLFPPAMIPFFKWIADYYLYPIGEVIKGALPRGINLYDFCAVARTPKGKFAFESDPLITPMEKELLGHLATGCLLKTLCKKSGKKIPTSLIYKMEEKGLVVCKREVLGKKTGLKTEFYVSLNREGIPEDRFFSARKKIIDFLKADPDIPLRVLKKRLPEYVGYLSYLKKEGFVSVVKKEVYRDPFGDPIAPDTPPVHTDEQKQVIGTIADSIGKGFFSYLLEGVTGSGKTEVYMEVAKKAVDQGLSVIVLVPEIALITQTERRFRARFGECVALLHSGLSAGERYDQWMRIVRNEATIVIGARSAIFAPLEKPGVIIVDEEHDASYKQESSLRYNARDLAVVRAKLHSGVVLMGSATPSVQSSYNAATKKFILLRLKERINKQPLPKINIVDLRKHRDTRGIRRFVTPVLIEAMKSTLSRQEQVLLFLNRRGFSTFPVCAKCGEAIKCKNCDISLTLHKSVNAYKCHFCGFTRAAASNCPACDSSAIKLLGLGTEKIEEAARALFPDARVARMDRDTTAGKGKVIQLLKKLKNREIDILVGTQMIAKGHDFHNITLVGIICADLSLSFPDFRAGERTFQLLAQVAGRAGRGAATGQVVLQTYIPEHFSIKSASNQNVSQFYDKEITFRKDLNYPPFSRIIQIRISGKDKNKTKGHAFLIGERCRILLEEHSDFIKHIEVLGPVEAPLPKLSNQYRWQILLKGLGVSYLHQFVHRLLFNTTTPISKPDVKVAVDVDPFSMM